MSELDKAINELADLYWHCLKDKNAALNYAMGTPIEQLGQVSELAVDRIKQECVQSVAQTFHSYGIFELESQLQAAQAKIKELEQTQEWISVDEKPKHGQRILVCYLPNDKTTNSVTDESIEYGFTDYCYRDDFPFMYGDYKISHWLPLPPQPKGE